jgi:thiamine biosynthesis protein ThiS
MTPHNCGKGYDGPSQTQSDQKLEQNGAIRAEFTFVHGKAAFIIATRSRIGQMHSAEADAAGQRMKITINGEAREVPQGLTLALLLAHVEIVGPRVAVERNGEIAPRNQWDATQIQEGDRLEVVHLVGGG